MKICITLDDVIRSKTKQFLKMYNKSINPDFKLDEEDMDTNVLSDVFPFDSKTDYNRFLYNDFAFEIFGEAPVVEKMLDKKLNLWMLSFDDNDEIEEKIDFLFGNSMEYNASIGYTYFFLSKIATRIREVYLPIDSSVLWDKCDVMITSDPKLIRNKPVDKKCVKIKMPYNKDVECNMEYDSLMALIDDKDFLKKLNDGKDI